MAGAPKIAVRGVGKAYPAANGETVALGDVTLGVGEGEFLCIVGPSGCGKSTLLRMIAGLEAPSRGAIAIAPGADPRRPPSAVVFQEYAVFPWKTLEENVSFGLRMRGAPRAEREAAARRWLGRMGLARFKGHYPHQISGGMKQRVAIARALASDPEVLLMDEPLGALDAQTRLVLQEELLAVWEETRLTVVYVTHSLEEAVLLGDRVILMSAQPGRILAEFAVDLPRPRGVSMLSAPEFGALRGRIWERLSAEVGRAMAIERGAA